MISPCEILQNDESKIRILRDSVKDDKNPKHTNQLESFVIKNFQCEICNYSNKKKRQMNLHIKTAHPTVKEFAKSAGEIQTADPWSGKPMR